jgi:hypothetical protein
LGRGGDKVSRVSVTGQPPGMYVDWLITLQRHVARNERGSLCP